MESQGSQPQPANPAVLMAVLVTTPVIVFIAMTFADFSLEMRLLVAGGLLLADLVALYLLRKARQKRGSAPKE